MRGQLLFVMYLGTLLILLIWCRLNNDVESHRWHPQIKGAISCGDCGEKMNKVIKFCSRTWKVGKDQKSSDVEHQQQSPPYKSSSQSSAPCKDCIQTINKVLKFYSKTWKKEDENHQEFRLQLSSKCNGSEKAIITQMNTPLGSKIIYDGERTRSFLIKRDTFNTFVKKNPFSNKTWHTCAVVGNGGILVNSSCGKMIDSADFVIRCNLPPVSNEYEEHVGSKTNVVTANPSIFLEKYGSLIGQRRPFVEDLCHYGDSMLLLPAFSFPINTAVCLRALYTIKDFERPIRPILFNPDYLYSLSLFWRTQGLKEMRLSTGIIMISLALEICENVHLYGFWPFSFHPTTSQELTNHYYDDRKSKSRVHAMPEEFDLLLKLHSQGVLKLHLGNCEPDGK